MGQSGPGRHNMTGGGVNPMLPFAFARAIMRRWEALQWQVQIEPAIRAHGAGLTLFADICHSAKDM